MAVQAGFAGPGPQGRSGLELQALPREGSMYSDWLGRRARIRRRRDGGDLVGQRLFDAAIRPSRWCG